MIEGVLIADLEASREDYVIDTVIEQIRWTARCVLIAIPAQHQWLDIAVKRQNLRSALTKGPQ